MIEKFIDKNFREDALALINWANTVLDRYMQQGLTATVRQLYYQGVSANVFTNTERNYSRLVNVMADARRAGLVDWDAIEDRGRSTQSSVVWKGPADILKQALEAFKTDKWNDQPNYVEVMCEKQALEGVFLPVCQRLEVPFSANKGYSSVSAMYETGHRLRERAYIGKKELHVIYFGDHDPSGMDMTRDVEDRLTLFAKAPVNVHRVALNMDQVEEYHLPENPAKLDDSRAAKYIAEFGASSWELDALDVALLAELVDSAVKNLRDEWRWEQSCQAQEKQREQMSGLVEAFNRSASETTDLDDCE